MSKPGNIQQVSDAIEQTDTVRQVLTSALEWYVIHTHPKSEQRAKVGLERIGTTVYLPMASRMVIPRHAKKKTPQKVTRAAFPGYLFVGLPDKSSWGAICDVEGVHDFIRVAGIPVQVATTIVEDVMAAQDIGGLDDPENEIRIRVGDRVMIAGGPFAGYEGTVTKVPKQRSEVQTQHEMMSKSTVTLQINARGSIGAVCLPLHSVISPIV